MTSGGFVFVCLLEKLHKIAINSCSEFANMIGYALVRNSGETVCSQSFCCMGVCLQYRTYMNSSEM